MNRKQFFRLFLVAFFPLLLLGFLATTVAFNKSGAKHANFLCAPFFTNENENCRSMGDTNSDFYKSQKKDHSAWFDVTEDGHDIDSSLSNFIIASARSVREAVIVSAVPFEGSGADVFSAMNSLVGKRAIVRLGMKEGERSKIYPDGVLLFCNSLEFAEKKGEYISRCYGDGWGGSVTYHAIGQSRDELDRLQLAINEQVASRKAEYLVYRLVMYPVFIYIFLIASLLVWTTIKAKKFVKGS